MIFVIEGKEYDVDAGLAKVSLHTLFELKVKHGISAKDLQGMANYLDKFQGKPSTELMDDKVALRAMMVVIWLARRHAGERISMEEANSFPMDSFFVKGDEPSILADPNEDDPAPKASSAAADGQEPGPNIPTT